MFGSSTKAFGGQQPFHLYQLPRGLGQLSSYALSPEHQAQKLCQKGSAKVQKGVNLS